jgi:hypothetical protein
VVAVNKVANVTMLEFVDILKLQNKVVSFKVAHRIESVKVAEFIDEDLRSGCVIFCVI